MPLQSAAQPPKRDGCGRKGRAFPLGDGSELIDELNIDLVRNDTRLEAFLQ